MGDACDECGRAAEPYMIRFGTTPLRPKLKWWCRGCEPVRRRAHERLGSSVEEVGADDAAVWEVMET